jgi:hypothetical protein
MVGADNSNLVGLSGAVPYERLDYAQGLILAEGHLCPAGACVGVQRPDQEHQQLRGGHPARGAAPAGTWGHWQQCGQAWPSTGHPGCSQAGEVTCCSRYATAVVCHRLPHARLLHVNMRQADGSYIRETATAMSTEDEWLCLPLRSNELPNQRPADTYCPLHCTLSLQDLQRGLQSGSEVLAPALASSSSGELGQVYLPDRQAMDKAQASKWATLPSGAQSVCITQIPSAGATGAAKPSCLIVFSERPR